MQISMPAGYMQLHMRSVDSLKATMTLEQSGGVLWLLVIGEDPAFDLTFGQLSRPPDAAFAVKFRPFDSDGMTLMLIVFGFGIDVMLHGPVDSISQLV